ncbi:MAG TPA: GH92 family glycosyl hydrolase [Chitinophagaceae bacterium]|jgi:predicted alpha-1,2-mannosidase
MQKGLLLLPGLLFFSCAIHAQALWEYVQPMSGTAVATTPAAQKHGEGTEQNANTIPAVGLPFGMTQWTAQTQATENKCIPPYFYKDTLLNGFRGTHWISGSCTQDYGSVSIMPLTGSLRTQGYAISFSHADETTGPAYYKLRLPSSHLTVELTATKRCGLLQFTLQQNDSLYLLITPNSDRGKGFVKMNPATGEIWGYNPVYRIYQGWGNPAGFGGWFYIRVQKFIAAHGTYCGPAVYRADSIQDKKGMGAFIGFAMNRGERLYIRVGTSFSSLEGAKKNLQQETGSLGFDQLCEQAKAVWQKALSQIIVHTTNEKDKRVFYTAMYHAMQHPRLMSDIDGAYPAFAGNKALQQVKNRQYYDDFSMWDIYRAQLPLFEILQPAFINQLVQSLVAKEEQGGWLPIFPCWNSYTAAMIGDHGTAFIASAWAKGIRGYDVPEAYRLMRKNAFETAPPDEYKNGMGRRALNSYLQYGYIPLEDSVPEAFHKKEQVSRTLEYAFDDYALSVVAKGLKKESDWQQLHRRAFNYRNVFDSSVGMVRGRYADGSWCHPFNADRRESYITEGTPRQYTFYVPQDIAGLSRLMGGSKSLENELDSLFAKNEYWHGNEPGHQVPFMYNYTEAPWKTQLAVCKILSEEYGDGPGGLSGNDDAGQMSAWYIFGAIGFYPVNPVSGEYLLCSPIFDSLTMALPGKKQVNVICHKTSPGAVYIRAVTWNGKPWHKNFIRHAMLQEGGKLDIWLQEKPSAWGAEANSRPMSILNH